MQQNRHSSDRKNSREVHDENRGSIHGKLRRENLKGIPANRNEQ